MSHEIKLDRTIQIGFTTPPRAEPISLRWLLTALGASLAVEIPMLAYNGLRIAPNGACFAFAFVGVALVSIGYAFRREGPRPNPVVSVCAEDALLFVSIALAGAVASYGVAAMTHGWVDARLVTIDHGIGFDWPTVYAATAAHPLLQIAGRLAYASIFATPAILIISFATDGKRDQARRFLASFWLAAVICLVLFRFLPTLGPLAYMWQGPVNYMPTSGLYQENLIPLLREGRAGTIDLAALRGLVGPPSFHAASAVLYILAAWQTRNLRWPLTILNVLMLLAIPVEGTHYATDVLGGAGVALLAFAIVGTIGRPRLVPILHAQPSRIA